jgi:hypothetical protein
VVSMDHGLPLSHRSALVALDRAQQSLASPCAAAGRLV